MPTVPSYNSNIQEQAIRTPQTSIDPPVKSVDLKPFQAAGDVAETVGKIAEVEKKKADQVRVEQFIADSTNKKNDLLYNPDNGAFKQKGEAAFNVLNTYGDEYKKWSDDAMKGLANDDQREMAQKVSLQHGTELHGALDQHIFKESQQYQTDTLKYGLEASQNDAVLNYQAPGKVAETIAHQQDLISRFASNNGISPDSDEFKVLTADAASKTHIGVLTRMVDNGQDLTAKHYYDSVKDQISGADVSKVEKVLEEGSIKGESQRQAQMIVSKGLNLSQSVEQARAITDPKIQDATVERLKAQFEIQKKSMEDQRQDQYQKVSDMVEGSKGTADIPVSMRIGLSPAENNAIDSRMKQLREGVEPESGGSVFYGLKRSMADSQTRDGAKNINLLPFRHQVTNSEFHELIEYQSGLLKGSAETEKTLNGVQTDLQIVHGTMKDIGLDPNAKPGSGAAKKSDQFMKMVDDQVISTQQRTGKKVTTPELQKIADDTAKKVVLSKGLLFDTKKYAYDVKTTDIPQAERVKIEDALTRFKMPITDKNVLDTYIKAHYAE